ncbi:hypothetical protein V5O48_012322 [Marasmius crinis-equi]|uniref:FAD-binding domain-containing protein n=1 Tax=Marasmius crinis-equi TaxID=585013 RepID=A0ABR3F336_9AGAR
MARPLTPGTRTRFGVAITDQNFDPTHLGDPEKAKDSIRNKTGRTDLDIGDFTWLSHFRPNMRMANKLQEGRAFGIGDAAHVHSPTGGQGINFSVQDASNLDWKLSLVLKGIANPPLLSTYNEERPPFITQLVHATSALYTHTVAKEKPTEILENGKPEDDNSWLVPMEEFRAGNAWH